MERVAENKKRKREFEMSLITNELESVLQPGRAVRVLEFGSGRGYQLPFLKRLGQVTACDLHNKVLPENLSGVEFVECSITETPFPDHAFDLVFSNHVIEHIEGLNESFIELKRIGAPDCLYAFSVPTNIWLLLSIPAQYLNKVRGLWKRMYRGKNDEISKHRQGTESHDGPEKSLRAPMRYFLFPNGHGNFITFKSAYMNFRIKSWKRRFTEAGFEIVRERPLLLYAPSEFPIVPTTEFLVGAGICSSILFVMRKRT